jgi:1-pyrroline-5-carboxylate dehydrogenase
MFTPFKNEPYVNFAEETPRRCMDEAIALVKSQLGRMYPIIINGEKITEGALAHSTNPARRSEVIGTTPDATPELADRAVAAAAEAFKSWSKVPVAVRARYLVRAAAILRRRIYEFSAWMVVESSKSYLEAYADAAEAIDFLEFYAREAVRWCAPHPTTDFPGESNLVQYIPIGVGAVIPPWNFPLAIMAGMTMAAVATGNTVVLKPAEQSPIVAAKFMEVLEEIGLPAGVVNFLPGPGETVGETLTGSPYVRFVSFTGSKDVGLHINQRIAITQPGQKWIKRGIFEMGGKDAILVDEDVDLDQVAADVVLAAFGFQGQKCSACSRLIVHKNVYDTLIEKVAQRASVLSVGDPAEGCFMGAVIDGDAFERIQKYIAIGKSEGTLVLGEQNADPAVSAEGWFVYPTIIKDVAPNARLAQEEIFGPVLAVIKAESFEHGLEIANSTDFGLTGAAYSNNRALVEKAREEFFVGNLYLNRKCTGALVDVQPFGGFNMSGTCSKAGGREYLGLFLQAKSVSERW